MLAKQPGAYQTQDTQVMFSPGPGLDPHPERRWRDRAPEEWEDQPVLSAWLEGEDVGASGSFYARYHEESGMLLYAEYGFITTVVRVDEADGQAPEIVREFKEGMVDE